MGAGIATLTMMFAAAVAASIAVFILSSRIRRMSEEVRALSEERRAAEEELRARDEGVVALIQALPEAAGIFDARGGILEANEAFLGLFQLSDIDAARASSASEISVPAENEEETDFPSIIATAARTPRDIDYRHVSRWTARAAGIPFIAEGRILPIDYDGVPAALAFVADADKRESTEAEKRRSMDELLMSARMDAASRMAGAVADEFNNILAGIVGNISLLRVMCESGHGPGGRFDMTDALARLKSGMDGCLRAGEAVRRLKDLSIGEKPAFARVELSSIVADVIEVCAQAFGDGARIEYEEPSRSFPVLANREVLERAILSVCLNAFRAAREVDSPSGIRIIRVSLRSVVPDPRLPGLYPVIEPDLVYARLTIRDEGIGLDSAALRKMFDPFDSTVSGVNSADFSMAVVYSTMRAHTGSVDVESAPNKGTAISLHLPLLKEKETPGTRHEESGIRRGSGRIGIASDHPSFSLGLSGMLRACGYTVADATSTAEAAEAWARSPADALVMDVSGGESSARRAYEEIRRLDPDARVLLVTGVEDDVLLRETLGASAARVLKKPLTLRKLSERVASLMTSEATED